MYSHGRVKSPSLDLHLNFVDFPPMIKLKIFFCGVNIFLLEDILPSELFHILLYNENRQKSSLKSVSIADVKHRAKYITCCIWVRSCLIYMVVRVQVFIYCMPRRFVFTGSSMYFTSSSVFMKALFVVNFIIFVSCRFRENLLAVNHSLIWDQAMFATEEKLSAF